MTCQARIGISDRNEVLFDRRALWGGESRFFLRSYVTLVQNVRENRMGGFRKGGFSNNRFVLKPDVAIASEVSILSKNSLAITDFHAKKTQHVQLFENPLPGTPPFAIPKTWPVKSLFQALEIGHSISHRLHP